MNFLTSKGIYSGKLINTMVANQYCKTFSRMNREYNKQKKRDAFRDICLTLQLVDDTLDYSDVYKFLEGQMKYGLIESEIEAGKTPIIQKDILNKLIACALKDIRDTDLTPQEVIGACIIILLSQIGMRFGELRLLESGKIDFMKSPDTLENAPRLFYLNFKTYKTTKSGFAWGETYMNEHAMVAYRKLEELTKTGREESASNFLFKNYYTKGQRSEAPYSFTTLRKNLWAFVLRHRDEIGLVDPSKEDRFKGFHRLTCDQVKQHHMASKYFKGLNGDSVLFRPNTHQFRVTLCNELFMKNVYYDWIRKHMNHLSYDMTQWYLRKEVTDKKVIEFKKKMLEGLVSGDFRLIGNDARSIENRIQEFVKEGKFNIAQDLEAIILAISPELPIREKSEGFCMKNSYAIECPTNEFVCAFNYCPNHYSYYKNADLTYQRFIDKQRVIKSNLDRGFTRQADMETNRLKDFVIRRLYPEIEEVKYEIERQGFEKVLEDNPKLFHILGNLSLIEDEVKQWI